MGVPPIAVIMKLSDNSMVTGAIYIESNIMFLGCVIGRRSITPSGLAKNIILDSIAIIVPDPIALIFDINLSI
jgi:hypothetical protein